MSLPETHKALVLSSFKDPLDLAVKQVPTPIPGPGSAIVQVLCAHVFSYGRAVYSGKMPYPMQLPMAPGAGSICRIAAVGSDATALSAGQLVLVDINVRARDDPAVNILQGLFAAGPGERLMSGEWRNGTYAEYAKVPLENIFPLDEDLLTKQYGHTINDLNYITTLLVPMGGLGDLDIKSGETVIVAPATGSFGGAAVTVALGMGARVIAAGRNETQLKKMQDLLGKAYGGRLSYVKLSSEIDADAQALQKASPGGKGADAYIDFSPPEAAKSQHFVSCLTALKTYGRAVFMGGIQGPVSIPYQLLMLKSLRLGGKFMYEREQVKRLIGMVESGLIKLGAEAGVEVVGAYKLEEAEDALNAAAKNSGFGKEVVFTP